MDISTLENERRRAIQQQGDLRMGVSGGWNVAGRNMRSSPYADFEPYDDGYDDPEDYRGKPVFGVEEDGQTFFDFPFVQAPNDMMIANFLAPSGTGKTLSDEWYEKGLETILETTEPGSWQQRERLNILEHQYLDQVNNPAMQIASASDIGQQVLQQRAEESKAGKIDRGSRSYIGEDHQRAREIDGEIYWYDEYKHMPFYQKILQKYGHTEELQQIQNQMNQ